MAAQKFTNFDKFLKFFSVLNFILESIFVTAEIAYFETKTYDENFHII